MSENYELPPDFDVSRSISEFRKKYLEEAIWRLARDMALGDAIERVVAAMDALRETQALPYMPHRLRDALLDLEKAYEAYKLANQDKPAPGSSE